MSNEAQTADQLRDTPHEMVLLNVTARAVR
jgi:hypothetical protein